MAHNPQDCDFLKTLTILYVEDDDDARELLGQFLRRRVGTVVTAHNGAAGLEAFRTEHPHILITDILMPVMDGLTMAQEIRKLHADVPIIVTTAFEQTDFLLHSIDIGIDKYVMKPVKFDRLDAALLACAHRLRAEEQLARQRKLEAEALRIKHLEAMGILAGGMAHDYNNLLQAILAYVSIARMNAEPGSQVHEFLTEAEKNSAQARELGKRLLLLAKGNNIFIAPGPLAPLITDAVNAVLEGTTITRRFELAENLPLVRLHRDQMQQVVTYLTVNALEAMPKGGTLGIAAGACTLSSNNAVSLPAGRYIHVTFRDTGTGIAPEHLPQIFDPYFSTKEIGNQKGMGLSLALCHTIIRKHNGMITAESTPGEGAAFHVYLPIA